MTEVLVNGFSDLPRSVRFQDPGVPETGGKIGRHPGRGVGGQAGWAAGKPE